MIDAGYLIDLACFVALSTPAIVYTFRRKRMPRFLGLALWLSYPAAWALDLFLLQNQLSPIFLSSTNWSFFITGLALPILVWTGYAGTGCSSCGAFLDGQLTVVTKEPTESATGLSATWLDCTAGGHVVVKVLDRVYVGSADSGSSWSSGSSSGGSSSDSGGSSSGGGGGGGGFSGGGGGQSGGGGADREY